MKMLHLSFCTPGNYKQGKSFALTGDTGIGTGAHLDARRQDKTQPTKADVEPYLTGKLLPRSPVVVASADIDVSDVKEGELSDQELTCAIGAAEGTRDSECKTNDAYDGHTDPGNGARNQGSFSYQHGPSSPAEADKQQLIRLRLAEEGLQAKADAKFGRSLSKPALAAALDLWNQSPAAGEDFVNNLTTATPNGQQIIEARSKSYVNPATGQLDAPGLGNSAAKVEADQARRTDEVLRQLEPTQQQRRLEQLDKK